MDWSKDVSLYREVLDGKEPITLRVFNADDDLTLERALKIANADNEAIAISGENYIQALAEKMRQAGTFLPTLTLGPSLNFSHSNGDTDNSQSVSANASASGSMSDLSNIEASKISVEKQKLLLLDQRQTILLNVAQAYYDVLLAEHQIEVYKDSVDLQTEKLRDQQARLKVGNGRQLDVAQSRADLAGTRASWTQAKTNAVNARSALARLMGVDAVTGKLTDAYTPPIVSDELQSFIDVALATRQDYLADTHTVEVARLGVESAIRQYLPSVSINFNYYLMNDPGSSGSWSGGISANIPIFSALSIESDIRSAWSTYRAAGLAQSQTRRIVVDDVQQAYQNVLNSKYRITDLNEQVDAANQAYDLAQKTYEIGSATNLERLTAKNDLLSAELSLLEEQYTQKTSYLKLIRSTGQIDSMIKIAAEIKQ
jgi:outer membrane protein